MENPELAFHADALRGCHAFLSPRLEHKIASLLLIPPLPLPPPPPQRVFVRLFTFCFQKAGGKKISSEGLILKMLRKQTFAFKKYRFIILWISLTCQMPPPRPVHGGDLEFVKCLGECAGMEFTEPLVSDETGDDHEV